MSWRPSSRRTVDSASSSTRRNCAKNAMRRRKRRQRQARAGGCTAEVRGSNPLRSTRKSVRAAPGSRSPQSLDNLVR